MVTQVEIDNELVDRAMETTGLPNQRAVVELALTNLIRSSNRHWETAKEAEPNGDFEGLLSNCHRYVDFSLFAAQMGLADED